MCAHRRREQTAVSRNVWEQAPAGHLASACLAADGLGELGDPLCPGQLGPGQKVAEGEDLPVPCQCPLLNFGQHRPIHRQHHLEDLHATCISLQCTQRPRTPAKGRGHVCRDLPRLRRLAIGRIYRTARPPGWGPSGQTLGSTSSAAAQPPVPWPPRLRQRVVSEGHSYWPACAGMQRNAWCLGSSPRSLGLTCRYVHVQLAADGDELDELAHRVGESGHLGLCKWGCTWSQGWPYGHCFWGRSRHLPRIQRSWFPGQ